MAPGPRVGVCLAEPHLPCLWLHMLLKETLILTGEFNLCICTHLISTLLCGGLFDVPRKRLRSLLKPFWCEPENHVLSRVHSTWTSKGSGLRNHTVQVGFKLGKITSLSSSASPSPGLCANSFCTLLALSPFSLALSFTHTCTDTHLGKKTLWKRKLYHPQRSGSRLSTEDESSAHSTLSSEILNGHGCSLGDLECSRWGSNDLQNQTAMIISLIEAFN